MPWFIGIDEAGYGPNLGPLVMSLAAVRVPQEHAAKNLWRLLGAVVCRADSTVPGRLVVDDSKKIHSPSLGLAPLELQILPFHNIDLASPTGLEDFWPHGCLTPIAELRDEPWAEELTPLPRHAPLEELRRSRQALRAACAARGIQIEPPRGLAVFPARFNELVRRNDSKAAVTAWAMRRLLGLLPIAPGDDSILIVVDKLGGRNHYHELLQEAFPECLVLCRGESGRDSRYQFRLGDVPCEVSFQPEADARYFPVALASMWSKYLRELLMEDFNRFWRRRLPEVRPTAGYPGDARRFFDEILPARRKLGIADDRLWRIR